ncbi:MAG: NUDIX hydrolase [Pyrinomonadaceae bacterium]
MLKRIIGKIWRLSPATVRARFVRLTQQTFTVSVGAIVTNAEGKVLLLDHVLRPASGWGIPGGFINKNEQPAEAVKREICEEIGLEIENIEMVKAHTYKRHVEILFRAEADGEGKVQSLEIKQVKWFSLNEMPQEMNRTQKQLIRQFAGGGKAE